MHMTAQEAQTAPEALVTRDSRARGACDTMTCDTCHGLRGGGGIGGLVESYVWPHEELFEN